MKASSKISIIAGEASGDTYGAELMKALRKQLPDVIFSGAGGPKMECEAILNKGSLDVWTDEAAVLGLWDVLKKYGYFRAKFSALLKKLTAEPPAAIILIDYPGFNLRLAKAIRRRKLPIKIFYYISPQVWAWNKRRIPEMARTLDLMICIFPFEKELYEASGLPTTFAGHPLVEKLVAEKKSSAQIFHTHRNEEAAKSDEARRTKDFDVGLYVSYCSSQNSSPTQHSSGFPAFTVDGYEISGLRFLPREKNLLGLFPGSREREVRRIFPVMLEAAREVMKMHPEIRCEAAASTPTHVATMQTMAKEAGVKIAITAGASHQLMQRATFGLVCSGTATLEAACFQLPYALVYNVAWLTYEVGRRLIKVPYLGIINILASRQVVREFIQHNATGKNLAEEALRFLKNPTACEQLSQELNDVISTLHGHGAYDRAATTMVEALKLEKNSLFL